MSGTSFSAMIGTKVWNPDPPRHISSAFVSTSCTAAVEATAATSMQNRCNCAANQSALTYDYAYYAWSNLLAAPKKVILPISGFPHRRTTGTTALDLQLCRHHTLTLHTSEIVQLGQRGVKLFLQLLPGTSATAGRCLTPALQIDCRFTGSSPFTRWFPPLVLVQHQH